MCSFNIYIILLKVNYLGLIFCTLVELLPPLCPYIATVQAHFGLKLFILMKGAQLQESLGSFKMRGMESKSETGHI